MFLRNSHPRILRFAPKTSFPDARNFKLPRGKEYGKRSIYHLPSGRGLSTPFRYRTSPGERHRIRYADYTPYSYDIKYVQIIIYVFLKIFPEAPFPCFASFQRKSSLLPTDSAKLSQTSRAISVPPSEGQNMQFHSTPASPGFRRSHSETSPYVHSYNRQLLLFSGDTDLRNPSPQSRDCHARITGGPFPLNGKTTACFTGSLNST